MPPIATPYAAIIPLDYATHEEYSVTYLDPNWASLVSLFVEPKTFLRQKGLISSSPRPWDLRLPAVALCRPLTDRPDLAPLILNLTRGETSPTVPAGIQWEELLLQSLWPSDLAGGLYVVEFALGTSFLSISYLPPIVPPAMRFPLVAAPPAQTGLSPATISYLDAPLPYTNITAHVDLATRHDQSLIARADFVVDMLESREPFAHHISNTAGFIVNYNMKAEGAPLSITVQPPLVVPVNANPTISIEVEIPANSPQPTGVRRCDFGIHIVQGLVERKFIDTCVYNMARAQRVNHNAAGKITHVHCKIDTSVWKLYSTPRNLNLS